jgi:staphylococcal nuclease domain-containing protein 1
MLTVAATVEKVLTGDRLIVRLMMSPTSHVQTMLLIAGIKCPSTKRVNASDKQEQAAEPFGDEAQLFVETRLLQRELKVELLGVSPQNQLVGTLKHPAQGSVAPHILKAGLARCTDFHSTILGSEMGVLRQAEKEARDAKRGMFHSHTASKTNAMGEAEATVSRIITADTLMLRNRAGVERRVSLSSVRQPKPSDPKQAPWGAEAKEFLRKKLIGKHVKCQINGKRAATDGYEEREMATLTHGGKNVALLLVENGFATVIRHRHDDTDRSPIYDELLQAEQQAQAEQKGMHNPKSPSTKKYVDYSENAEKAKRQMALYARQKKIPAVVDYVKSGSRFTILIARDDAKLTFVLGGIRAPRTARNATETSEPFGPEAHEFANKRCLQRDVEIDVDDIDKVGGFIGTLYVNRENLARLLLEEGLASVHAYSAERSGHATELFAAEQRAKELRKGMWHDWTPSADDEAAAHEASATNGATNGAAAASAPQPRRRDDYRDALVTHVEPNGRLKLQLVGAGTTALDKLTASLRTLHTSSHAPAALTSAPRAGDVVAARFSADGAWYRARVRRVDREGKRADVLYVDYGNGETLPWSELRPLGTGATAAAEFGTQALRPQAVDADLSFVRLPENAEYALDAVEWLARRTDGRALVAAVDAEESGGVLCVSLFDGEGDSKGAEDSINVEMVREGWAMVARKMKGWERAEAALGKVLAEREREAKEDRLGMWEYGDISTDD